MPHFQLCIIGAGSGNSIIDERFHGWSVALVDDGRPFGGTCLNRGCIPTKMFVYPADLCALPADAARVDVAMAPPTADFAAIRDRIFGRIDPIAAGGEAWRAAASNVTLYRETARFIAPGTLQVGASSVSEANSGPRGERCIVTADRFVIAAGSRATLPPVDGLDAAALAGRVHTSDTIMRIDALPASLVIIGGGFVAAEFAHVFAAFGTRVTMLVRGDRLLRKEDAEIARRYTEAAASYVDLRLNTQATRADATADGVRLSLAGPDGTASIEAELVLVATGRRPNGDRLNASAAGIELDDAGYVRVDAQQRTTAEGVWALGDVCSPYQLKHVANHEARVVAHNLLHPEAPVDADHRFVPHAVFGRPQVASVGLTEDAARAAGLDVAVAVQEYSSVAYGWAMEDAGHCCKLVADRTTGRLVGAHLIGPEASLLIQPLIQAMSLGTDVETMARGQYWIHPALAEVVENALLAIAELCVD